MTETVTQKNTFIKVKCAALKQENGRDVLDFEYDAYIRPLAVTMISIYDRDSSKSVLWAGGRGMIVMESADILAAKFENVLEYSENVI
jgi:hypothetical protein